MRRKDVNLPEAVNKTFDRDDTVFIRTNAAGQLGVTDENTAPGTGPKLIPIQWYVVYETTEIN